ncbi:sensor histidine kinase [Thauera phenylacetica]|jgi:signal transduction histidine kinase|uniref:histidine kinase n=1 Tax=Thauera phenylacetica B4P TaxID=1234382 RepID=N6ZT38_9RHOO|nr:HAMP domain-containing sensor histidine kinase [Thauera phenylacetica]ENO97473.1 sensor protein [Thauera phenylacetica B4P]MBP6490730.1 HAMP domain-containing histidine kinase [Thauera sp.]
MTPAIQILFNRLSDGLAIIAPDGRLRFANEGMLELLPLRVGGPIPHVAIAAVVDQALAGHVSLPHAFESELAHPAQIAAPDRLAGHVVRSPAGKDLVLVLRNMTQASLFETTIANLGSLVEQSLLEPLQRFTADFAGVLEDASRQPGQAPSGLQAHERTLADGQRLVQQLLDLVRLAQLGGGRPLAAEDRIELADWLPRVLARHETAAQVRGQRLSLEPVPGGLPVIYGSAHWLGLAFDACIDNALEHSDNGIDITLAVSASAAFVRITLRNRGRGLRSPLLRKRLMQPLMRGAEAAARAPGLGLGLPLARHIIEMHHGRLALEQELDGFVTASIELPTSTSPFTSAEADIAQAQRYASDLARLMTRRAHHAGEGTAS